MAASRVQFAIHSQLAGGTIIDALFLTALAVFGLVFGSFANVVIWRFPRGESLSHPDSHCPECNTPIIWRDNIPVLSWMLLRGRCRACDARISARYPLVELTSGALWVAAGLRFGMTAQAAWAVIFFYLLLILAFIDLDTMRLPNPLVMLLAATGLVGAVAAQVLNAAVVPLLGGALLGPSPIIAALLGALVCSLPALVLSVLMAAILKRPALGMGDVKLLGVIGIYLGAYGLLALFVGSLLGAVYGVAAGSRSSGRQFPFGPALAAGAVIVALFGQQMWGWYLSLLAV